MSTETVQPEDMKWLEKGVFGIAWSDGHQGVYPIRYLRLHCPCAACTDEWTGELKLKTRRRADVHYVERYPTRGPLCLTPDLE